MQRNLQEARAMKIGRFENLLSHIKQKGLIVIYITIFMALLPFFEAYSMQSQYLLIKKVIDSGEDKMVSMDYEYGEKKFPDYEYHGLSEYFLIRKKADIVVKPRDVKLIEIKKVRSSQSHILLHEVTIYFNPLAAKKVSDYSKMNLKKKFALEIDKKVFFIGKIVEVVETKMTLTFMKRSLEEIMMNLKKLSNNIIVKD